MSLKTRGIVQLNLDILWLINVFQFQFQVYTLVPQVYKTLSLQGDFAKMSRKKLKWSFHGSKPFTETWSFWEKIEIFKIRPDPTTGTSAGAAVSAPKYDILENPPCSSLETWHHHSTHLKLNLIHWILTFSFRLFFFFYFSCHFLSCPSLLPVFHSFSLMISFESMLFTMICPCLDAQA